MPAQAGIQLSTQMLRFFLLILALFLLFLTSTFAYATPQDLYPFSSPADAQRFQAFIKTTRCVVCQNQTLAESNAPLAKDLRDKIYTLIKDQQSDADITAFLTQRYGTFIFMRPPVNYATLALWLAPLLIFFLTIAFLVL